MGSHNPCHLVVWHCKFSHLLFIDFFFILVSTQTDRSWVFFFLVTRHAGGLVVVLMAVPIDSWIDFQYVGWHGFSSPWSQDVLVVVWFLHLLWFLLLCWLLSTDFCPLSLFFVVVVFVVVVWWLLLTVAEFLCLYIWKLCEFWQPTSCLPPSNPAWCSLLCKMTSSLGCGTSTVLCNSCFVFCIIFWRLNILAYFLPVVVVVVVRVPGSW